MKLYSTKIEAISPVTGELSVFEGPNVPGISFEDAHHFCETHGLGYCLVTHEFKGYKALNDNNPMDYKAIYLN